MALIIATLLSPFSSYILAHPYTTSDISSSRGWTMHHESNVSFSTSSVPHRIRLSLSSKEKFEEKRNIFQRKSLRAIEAEILPKRPKPLSRAFSWRIPLVGERPRPFSPPPLTSRLLSSLTIPLSLYPLRRCRTSNVRAVTGLRDEYFPRCYLSRRERKDPKGRNARRSLLVEQKRVNKSRERPVKGPFLR